MSFVGGIRMSKKDLSYRYIYTAVSAVSPQAGIWVSTNLSPDDPFERTLGAALSFARQNNYSSVIEVLENPIIVSSGNAVHSANVAIDKASTAEELETIRVQNLGRKGLILENMKSLGKATPEQRK
jgi:hypothetical protein